MAADIDRIKENIGKMIDQNATDDEIAAYMKDEGTTIEQLRAGPGFFEQKGGLADYLPAGVTDALQRVDDMTQSAGNALTRGFGDKLFGTQDQTAAARQRVEQAGGSTLPGDIATGVVSSPYRIGSAGVGAIAGGLEGAATAYGNQPNWVPGLGDAGDILWEAGKGAALGSGLQALGGRLGEWWQRGKAKKAQIHPTDKSLEDAVAARDLMGDMSAGAQDQRDMLARLQAARAAGDKGRGAFSAVPTKGADEAAMAAEIAAGKSATTKLGETVDPLSITQRRRWNPTSVAPYALDAGLHLMGIPSMGAVGTAITGTATALSALGKSNWANKVSPKEMEDFAALIRDPSGKGLRTDPQAVAAARDMLAKIGIQGGKELP